MRVAIDTGPLESGDAVRGIGVHTRELYEGLKKIKGLKVEFADLTNSKSLTSNQYDIVHFQKFHPFFASLPSKKPKAKTVLTIHDLIPLIYPKHYPAGIKGKLKFWLQKRLIRNVDAVITISETSKKDIIRFLPVHSDKVHVVRLAPRRIFKPITDHQPLVTVQKKYALPDSFVLYVGDINYNKNIPALIKAARKAGVPLVICGKQAQEIENLGEGLDVLQGPMDHLRFLFNIPHPELAHYSQINEEIRANPDVFRLGFVPDEDLVAIYNLATVYCQPSFYEGFGLPVLEAMACGTPVVASKIQAHVEIADGAALFADPKKADDFAKKIRLVIKDSELKKKLIKKGFERIKEFSWEKTARNTAKVYKNLLLK